MNIPRKRDVQRSRVYAAEQFIRTIFDHASTRGPAIDFLGTSLTLPPEKRFSSISDIQHYVNTVLALPEVQDHWSDIKPLIVRARRGTTAAHYETHTGIPIIAIPDTFDTWAMRELVILHEITHHLSNANPAHGPEFTASFTELAHIVLGPEAGYLIRVIFSQEQIR